MRPANLQPEDREVTEIQTALGPIDSSDMGFTLSHEHVAIGFASSTHYPEFNDRDATFERVVRYLSEAKTGGVDTILDVAPHDQARDVRLQADVSQASGVNIVVSSGTWLDVPYLFEYVPIDRIADFYVREITEGIDGTNIRAGILKCASDTGGVTSNQERVLRAAARASMRTNAPIMTHTYAPERVGDQQVAILNDEGIDMSRICIGHSNDSTDLNYLEGLLKSGVWLGMDHLTFEYREGLPNLSQRLKTIKELIDSGYENKLMLGHDWAIAMPIFAENLIKSRDEYNPYGYEFIRKIVIPELLRIGVTERVIHAFMVINPSKFLTGEH